MLRIINFANTINNIQKNKYFININNSNIENFITSQIKFIEAIDHWSKILGLMIYKVPSYKERLILINNLNDEHGDGDPNKNHVNTFKNLLDSLINKTDKNEEYYLTKYKQLEFGNDPIENFNKALIRTTQKDWIFSVSAFAMIEYTYIKVSSMIHKYLLNYFEPNKIHHYTEHEILDETHALELFKLIEPYYEIYKDVIEIGIAEGYTIINEMYDGLNRYL